LEKHLSTDRPGPCGGLSATLFRLRLGTKIVDNPVEPRTIRLYSVDRPAIIHGPSAWEDLVQPEGDKLSKRNYRAGVDRPGPRADRPCGVTEADSR
jgi:hypothetical protein